MFGLKRRQTDERLCCPVCGWRPIIRHGANDSWSSIYRYACPRGHMSTGWYTSPGSAWEAWLDLIGLTDQRLKGHDND